MKQEHAVYIIENNINQHKYVGYSSDANRRWMEHKRIIVQPNHEEYNKPLYYAMREYGVENFTFQVIMIFDTERAALKAEEKMVDDLRTNIKKYGEDCGGYNLAPGGGKPPIKIRTLSPEQEKQACDMYESGRNVREIADYMHSTMPIVSRCLKIYNIKMRKAAPSKILNEIQEKEVCDIYMSGRKMADIASMYNTSNSIIRNTLLQYDIHIRTRQERPGNCTIINDITKDNICFKYINGQSGKSLSEEYKCDLSTIYDILNNKGVPLKKTKCTPEEDQDIYNKYINGMSCIEISKIYNKHESTIRNRIKYVKNMESKND